MSVLQELIRISREYGGNPDYVIAGGGNTSVKDGEVLHVKASGVALATIDAKGFVTLSRSLLTGMETRTYPEDPAEREAAVKADLHAAIRGETGLRPSVETSLHNLIPYAFVVHTHPTRVNGLMCGRDVAREVEKRFGSAALYVPYTDPGFTLFQRMQTLIRQWKEDRGDAPRIIFLQNHGVFVGADSAAEIEDLYAGIFRALEEGTDLNLPETGTRSFDSNAVRVLTRAMEARGRVVRTLRSPLIDALVRNPERLPDIRRPFTPDIIVYCKSNYLFLQKGMEEAGIRVALQGFESEHGYLPRVVVEEGQGLLLSEENPGALQTVEEVFTDMMKIAYLTRQFGGPHPMEEGQIDFIDNWEAEHYRRKMAR
ncbi:MAG: class II aldolase/adducin family protein [Bacteroidales bacterium]